MNTLDHEVVQDLLPMYADDMTHPKTAKQIEEHLKSCPKCQKDLEAMKQSYTKQDPAKPLEKGSWLKKIHKNQKMLIACLVLAALAIAGLGWMSWKNSQPSLLSPALIDPFLNENNDRTTLNISASHADPTLPLPGKIEISQNGSVLEVKVWENTKGPEKSSNPVIPVDAASTDLILINNVPFFTGQQSIGKWDSQLYSYMDLDEQEILKDLYPLMDTLGLFEQIGFLQQGKLVEENGSSILELYFESSLDDIARQKGSQPKFSPAAKERLEKNAWMIMAILSKPDAVRFVFPSQDEESSLSFTVERSSMSSGLEKEENKALAYLNLLDYMKQLNWDLDLIHQMPSMNPSSDLGTRTVILMDPTHASALPNTIEWTALPAYKIPDLSALSTTILAAGPDSKLYKGFIGPKPDWTSKDVLHLLYQGKKFSVPLDHHSSIVLKEKAGDIELIEVPSLFE